MIEITVACTLLSALFAMGGALFVRIYRSGQDAEYRSIALQEVANELESRLRQSAENRAAIAEGHSPSEEVRHVGQKRGFNTTKLPDDLGIVLPSNGPQSRSPCQDDPAKWLDC